MSRWIAIGLLLALGMGAALRFPALERRPLHTDEAVHAYKFAGLWERGEYRYDPDEYHGPTLYYATLPFAWLSGARTADDLRELTLRLVPLAFGLGLIALLFLVADGLGVAGTVAAGVLTAVSTAMVFFSRYYIHEMLLVFFTVLFGAALWRYTRRPGWGWALLAGLALGLMHATKETLVFNLAALVLAGIIVFALDPDRAEFWDWLKAPGRRGHLAAAAGMGVVVSVTLFTSCFQNWAGPLDSLRTYVPWLDRAGGASPHIHPWSFYIERLFWFHPAKGPVFSELLIGVLAFVGLVAAFLPDRFPPFHRGFARVLGLYTVLLTVAFTVVGYKTPWCVLGFLHGMILLAGIGTAALFRIVRPFWGRSVLALALLGAAAQLAFQARLATNRLAADQRNPWVYAHTSKDLLRLVDRVLGVARIHGDATQLAVNVMAPGGDYWPLPWYLRSLKEARWSPGVPADPFAPVVVASARLHLALDEKSDKRWLSVGYYEHRPRVFFEMFVELELWKRYVATLPRDRDEDDEDEGAE
jgi:uncharacterized protein (TIGR03663 family)